MRVREGRREGLLVAGFRTFSAADMFERSVLFVVQA